MSNLKRVKAKCDQLRQRGKWMPLTYQDIADGAGVARCEVSYMYGKGNREPSSVSIEKIEKYADSQLNSVRLK